MELRQVETKHKNKANFLGFEFDFSFDLFQSEYVYEYKA
jgi:hypothetical protein